MDGTWADWQALFAQSNGRIVAGLGITEAVTIPALYRLPISAEYIAAIDAKAPLSAVEFAKLICSAIDGAPAPSQNAREAEFVKCCWFTVLSMGYFDIKQDGDKYELSSGQQKVDNPAPAPNGFPRYAAPNSVSKMAALLAASKLTWRASNHHLGTQGPGNVWSGFLPRVFARFGATWFGEGAPTDLRDDGLRALVHSIVHICSTRAWFASLPSVFKTPVKHPNFSRRKARAGEEGAEGWTTIGVPNEPFIKGVHTSHLTRRMVTGGAGTKQYAMVALIARKLTTSGALFLLPAEAQLALITVCQKNADILEDGYAYGEQAAFLTDKASEPLPENELERVAPFVSGWIHVMESGSTLARSGVALRFPKDQCPRTFVQALSALRQSQALGQVGSEDFLKFTQAYAETATVESSADVLAALQKAGIITADQTASLTPKLQAALLQGGARQ